MVIYENKQSNAGFALARTALLARKRGGPRRLLDGRACSALGARKDRRGWQMSTITISTGKFCSDLEAVRAVEIFMTANDFGPKYQSIRSVTIDGSEFTVTETIEDFFTVTREQ